MGVATNENLCYENITALLQAADTLLYKAKFRGSEQICLGQHRATISSEDTTSPFC